jgi:hypothetical protein
MEAKIMDICLLSRDPARLTVSLAESICLRALIKPVTFPFKLWASWKLVLATKPQQQERIAAVGLSNQSRLKLARPLWKRRDRLLGNA